MLPNVHTLLRTSFEIYRKHAQLIFGYLAYLLIPFAGMILIDMLPNQTDNGVWQTQLAVSAVLMIVQTILWLWITIIIFRLASDAVTGKKISVTDLQKGVSELIWPLVFVGLLQGLIMLGGILLLIIPAIIFAVWFCFAQISVILDKKRGVEAFSYSRSLVRGRFWAIFWRAIIYPGLLTAAIFIIVGIFITGVASLLGLEMNVETITAENFGQFFNQQTSPWLDTIDYLAQLVFMPLLMIYQTVVYCEAKKTPMKEE